MLQSPNFRNRLLAQLPTQEMATLLPHLERIDLPMHFVIVSAGEIADHVYFLESGLGSIVAVSPEGAKAEAGMFGWEGFAPTSPAIGFDLSHFELVIQSPGIAHRIAVSALWELSGTCPELYSMLHRSSHNLATQVAYTALSNAIHHVDERLARWLLMCHDRVADDEITITHDYIALMLAVRRPSVTTALHVLEGNRFIKSTRKLITIRNRKALEAFAHDAYGKPEAEYQQLFGPRRKQEVAPPSSPIS